ncbi:hypothetical protein AB0B45_25220 [Nonomuraea sp. NPDC049152]|uniref:hypothetical protein n=1 Tax=Nonomuraea sp. NPDC049152 TaxID=3154350 RepID=UPI00340AA608
MRRVLLALSLMAATLGSAVPAHAAAGTVTMKFYDTAGTGTELSQSQVKAVMHGDKGSDGDALVNPTTLQVVKEWPLHTGGTPARWQFDIPSQAVGLAVNWPTARGFSTVVIDNGGGGFTSGKTVVFNYEAAKDSKRRLDAALAARPDYTRSTAFDTAYARAASNLGSAAAATTDADRGKYGQRALDAVNTANDLLLSEYGPRYAKLHGTDPWMGVTVDDTKSYPNWANLAAQLTEPFGWVRIVFDPEVDKGNMSHYRSAVTAAHEAGLRVIGQPLDSAIANKYSRARYLDRIKLYVDAYPDVEAWEVANEINGCWVDGYTDADGTCDGRLVSPDDRIKNKIADAAAYVRATRPAAKVIVTLYWQLGTDKAQWSTFNWARANLSAAVRRNIDIVTLSSYVEDAPLGLAFDQVMNTLRAEFPSQRIAVGELDYWSEDTTKAYWAFDKADTSAARRMVASHYYAASLGYPQSLGGCFWWYFIQEVPDDPALQSAIRSVTDKLR